jgi:hypothetical protein
MNVGVVYRNGHWTGDWVSQFCGFTVEQGALRVSAPKKGLVVGVVLYDDDGNELRRLTVVPEHIDAIPHQLIVPILAGWVYLENEADVMEDLLHRLRQQLSAVSEAHNAISVKEKKTLDKP